MSALIRKLWHDEAGFIVSAEIVIILTIGVIGMVVGLSSLQNALISEFADLGLAFQALNQSYSTPTYRGCMKWWGGRTSWVAGSAFLDVYDGCAGYGAAAYDINGYGLGGVGGYGVGGYVLPAVGEPAVIAPAVPSATGAAAGTTTGVTAPATGIQPVPQGTPLPPTQCTTCP